MANVKFSQFTSETPSIDSFFVGYNSNTNVNTRFSLAQLSTALGLSSYVTLATTQTISGSKIFSSPLLVGSSPAVTVTSDIQLYSTSDAESRWVFNSGSSTVAKILSFRASDLQRWAFRVDDTETGGNAGQNFHFRRYNDDGTFLDTVMTATRSTGHIRIYQDLRLDGDLIVNAGGMTISNTELQYLDGVSSNIQTQLNGKEPTISTGTASQFWKGNKSWATLSTSDIPSLDASKITSGTFATSLLPKVTRAVSMATSSAEPGPTTAEVVLQTLTIPANTLSVGDVIKIGFLFSFNNTAGNKFVRIRQTNLAGTLIPNNSGNGIVNTANLGLQSEYMATVVNSTTLRFPTPITTGVYGSSNQTTINLTVDLTQPIVFVITGQKATSSDTCTCETAYLILISQ